MLVPNLDGFSSLYPLPASLVNLGTNGSSGISKYMNSTSPTLLHRELIFLLRKYQVTKELLHSTSYLELPCMSSCHRCRCICRNLSSTMVSCSYKICFDDNSQSKYPMGVNDSNNQNGLAFGAGNINPLKAIDPGLV
ncbi:uncharacterized protein [Coffea arabica]|uniref:Cupin type-1 domain-containing protein n=1 Tax=Coffea arabica TaxID=13443 RepID=A0A6P6UTJ8_COFAR